MHSPQACLHHLSSAVPCTLSRPHHNNTTLSPFPLPVLWRLPSTHATPLRTKLRRPLLLLGVKSRRRSARSPTHLPHPTHLPYLPGGHKSIQLPAAWRGHRAAGGG